MQKRPVTPEAARLRMADLCARSEQCEHDIREKLSRQGIRRDDADSIIATLREQRFIDDERFAAGFARDKCRFSAWGRRKIRMGLVAKRIPAAAISTGLAAIGEEEYKDALRRVAAAKARSLDLYGEEAREARMKLYRHILSRGFESVLAAEAVKEEIRKQKG